MTTTHTEPDHAMVDLETLGTQPFSPILTIGACAFSLTDEPIADVFYQAIDLESCLDLGMKPSGDTIKWWMQQDEGARSKAFHDPERVSLPLALDAFTEWLNSRPLVLCGNSSRFDLGLLEAAYKLCRKEVPWQWWKEGCYRQIKNLPGAKSVKLERIGMHHNALDDAISQALHMRKIFKTLGLTQQAATAA